jgi:ligand-binding sensor domain-containing protein/signal transduction histidine kinase
VCALDPNRAMSQYIRDRWGAEQGLPKGPVYAITQTPDGYLWIATEAGVVRFDGLNFQLMPGSARSGPVTNALGLTPDRDGNLWVRVLGPTMLKYRDGIFENPMAALGYSNVSAMCQTNRGGMLAAAMEHGAITYRRGRFEVLAAARAMPRSPVIALAQTPSGEIWMGTRDAGLFRVSGDQASAVTQGLPDPKVNCLLPDGERGLWIGTDGGVARWDGEQIRGEASLAHVQALAMAKDFDGNLWVGTDSHGLLRLNPQGVVALDPEGRGSGEAVTAVFEDREGNLWTGSAGGIERLRDSAFVTYSQAEGLPSKSNGPVYVDGRNRTWFAPAEGGLFWLEHEKPRPVAVAGLGSDVIYSIAGSGEGVWAGRQRGGLTRLEMRGAGFASKTYTRANGLAEDSVYAVHESRDGTVWAGTLTAGVSRLRKGVFTTFTTADGLASNSILSILESGNGTIWFATPQGLTGLAGERWKTFTTRDGLPSDTVNCIFEDSAGRLWAGTAAGLALQASGRFRIPTIALDSLREPVLGIAEDQAASLWIATATHVLRVKRDALVNGVLHDGDVREYGTADGLRGTEGVKRHRSVVSDGEGRIWFSMDRGLSMVDPARLKISSAPALVYVQTVSADGESIGARGGLKLPGPRQRIAFHFAGLSLAVPERIRFRYRLDGFDEGWSDPVAAREAVYTNLNPGAYRFRVMASNADGLWNGREAALGFEIRPRLWQTAWFRLCALVGCALAALGIYRFRLHQMAGRLNLRFEERLAERTLIAKELHDTMLQGFMGASMQLHVAAGRLPDDSPAKPPVNRILEIMAQVIDEGRNTVRGLRLTDNRAEDLAKAFSRAAEELAGGREIDFRMAVEGERPALHPVVRDDVYRMGREILASAFGNPGARRIDMELEYTRKRLRILLRENGNTLGNRRWDLAGMRERAERMGARLSVWRNATGGTEVELSVPGHVAFEPQPSKGPGSWFAGMPARKDRRGPGETDHGDD